MIDLYTASTPNGWKVSITLEELSMPYKVKEIDLIKGDQKKKSFLKINPNGRIPAIIDREENNLAIDGPSKCILSVFSRETTICN